MPVVSPQREKSDQIIVAVFGASNHTYAEATCSKSLPDWIACDVHTFDLISSTLVMVVSDNLLSSDVV